MQDTKWTQTAWMAIGAAALTPVNVLLSFLADLPIGSDPLRLVGPLRIDVLIALVVLVAGTAAAVLSLIALYRFREMLNERYAFHGIDTLVTFVINTIAVLVFVSVGCRMAIALLGLGGEEVYVALAFAIPVVLLGMAVGIVSIIVGVRLLSMESDSPNLIRPYALISILGGACFP